MRWRLSSLAHRMVNDKGQVFIIVALSSLALTGFVALATDIGYYMHERQQLQHALDAAALAGAQLLPQDGDDAERIAREFAQKNDALDLSKLNIRFGCFVDPDQDNPGLANSKQVNALCTQLANQAFDCPGDGKCYHPCEFNQSGDRCNTISVQAEKTVDLFLAPAIGGALGSLNANLEGHACRGGCGPPPNIAMLLLLDNSASMFDQAAPTDPVKFHEAQEGATSILRGEFLVQQIHEVALATATEPHVRREFTDDYFALANAVESLQNGGTGTNFAQPINEALTLFDEERFKDAKKQIILLTDGKPRLPAGEPCRAAKAAAQRAKDEDIRIFLIHYNTNPDSCPDTGEAVNIFLPGLATRESVANHPGNCQAENEDQDDYFCETDGADLREIFRTIVTTILNDVGSGSRLVDLSGFN